MRVWRICSRRHRAFDGKGARLHGGRWNLPGVAIVYTSQSLSLAVLEQLVHVHPDLTPRDWVAVPAEIPDGVRIETIDVGDLPTNWREYPAPHGVQRIGTRWAESCRCAALWVPSVVVPEERNLLLNPTHADFRRIRIGEPRPFHLDARLARS